MNTIEEQRSNSKILNFDSQLHAKNSNIIKSHKRNNSHRPKSNFFEESSNKNEKNEKDEKEINENDIILICLKNSINIISRISEEFEKYGHYESTFRKNTKPSPYRKPSLKRIESTKNKKEREIPNRPIKQNFANKTEYITNSHKNFQNLPQSEKNTISNNIVEYSEIRIKNYGSLFNTINTSLYEIKDFIKNLGKIRDEEHNIEANSFHIQNLVNAFPSSIMGKNDSI